MARILWIEDEARDQLIEYVGPIMRNGHIIDIVEDASEGYQRLKEAIFDVIICDLLIKAGSDYSFDAQYPGLALLKRLFNDGNDIPDHIKNRIMVFTAVVDAEIIQQIKDLGIKRIRTKKNMEKTKLRFFVEEILTANQMN